MPTADSASAFWSALAVAGSETPAINMWKSGYSEFSARRPRLLASASGMAKYSIPSWPPPAHFSATAGLAGRSEEHTSELQSLMRISYAVFCLKKKTMDKQYTSDHVSSHKFESRLQPSH